MSIGHTLGEFAAHLLTIEADMRLAEEVILEKACRMIEKAAKRVIGTYDYNWEQLAEDTQAERARLGYPPNEPLLRKGPCELPLVIMSIMLGWKVLAEARQKLHYPPRSFLGEASMQNEHRIHEMAFTIVSGVMAHGGPNYHLFKMILDEIEKGYHSLKKLGEELVDEDEK